MFIKYLKEELIPMFTILLMSDYADAKILPTCPFKKDHNEDYNYNSVEDSAN